MPSLVLYIHNTNCNRNFGFMSLLVFLWSGIPFSPGESWVAVTSDVLPVELRGFLECRVQAEEESAAQQQGSYYHEGFKRKVYSEEEVW